jgi:nucleotide-binding universal stress UspA family protein
MTNSTTEARQNRTCPKRRVRQPVNAIDIPLPNTLAGLTGRYLGPKLAETGVRRKVNEQLADVASERGIKTTVHISPTPGNTAKRIADLAHEANADLIVVGTRGHSAVVATILGSVTQRLLHMAHCPVLAVPPGDRPNAGADTDKLTAVG